MRLIKSLSNIFYRPLVKSYLKHDRSYNYNGLEILVKKGVFHPGFFFSTSFILDELAKHDLRRKSVIELGAGSGLISFFAASKGADVTASDISDAALEGLEINNSKYGPIKIVRSDLFNNISQTTFDYIVINPPYFPQNPSNDAERAWYCGNNHEYFVKLFAQLREYLSPSTQCLLSLSDECDLKTISNLSVQNGISMELLRKRRFFWEMQYLYTLKTIKR